MKDSRIKEEKLKTKEEIIKIGRREANRRVKRKRSNVGGEKNWKIIEEKKGEDQIWKNLKNSQCKCKNVGRKTKA